MEFHELKVKVFEALLKFCNYEHVNGTFDITVDESEPVIFGAKGFINAYWSGGNYEINQVSIGEAYFQYPDFETELPRKYIQEIEKFCEDKIH